MKKTMHGKYNYQCTVLIAWHKCCSVWRTSVHSSQYGWTLFVPLSTVVILIFFKIGEELNFENFKILRERTKQKPGQRDRR